MDKILLLLHVLIIPVITASAVTVAVLRRTIEIKKIFKYIEIFLAINFVASVFDLVLYYRYTMPHIRFDTWTYFLGCSTCCSLFGFAWLCVVTKYIGNKTARMFGMATLALFASYMTSCFLAHFFSTEVYERIIEIFNFAMLVMVVLALIMCIRVARQKRGSKYIARYFVLIASVFVFESVVEILAYNTNSLVNFLYIVAWAIISIATIVTINREIHATGKVALTEEEPKTEDEVLDELKKQFSLTDREKEILHLIVDGKSNSDIAGELFIGTATVKTHIHNILNKMEMGNKTEIILLVKNRMK